MPVSEARVPTSSASRYLTQLCKHWSHRFAVTFTPEQGRVPFAPDQVCTFEAGLDLLIIRIEAADPDALARLEGVVLGHLRRFAFREDLAEVRWSRTG